MEIFNKIWIGIRKVTDELFDEDEWLIKAYHGYSNQEKIMIRGRVIQNEGVVNVDEDSVWDNLVNNIRSLASDELEHSKINITHDGNIYETYTDHEGYFAIEIDNISDKTQSGNLHWGSVHIELPDFKNAKGKAVQTESTFIVSHAQTEFGIISDIDDTVLQTHVDSIFKVKVIYNTLFKNAKTRLPFEEMPQVLQKLSKNNAANIVNPIFYLSNSPWNLYEMIHAFLKLNEIPDGPLFLRDFGLHRGNELKSFKNHKINTLNHLFKFYDFPFVLIGDATENDTKYYVETFKKFPNRVRAIFIRESKRNRKNEKIQEIIDKNPEIPLILFSDLNEILACLEK